LGKQVVIISCGIFRRELEHLKALGSIVVPMVFLDSMLHMHPMKLQELLDKTIAEYPNHKIVLLYGDCHARMVDYQKNPDIVRSQGMNCCEIMLGTQKYHELRKAGAFIILPEWAERWRVAFVDYMGFTNSKSASLFMNEMHHKLVYIDTGFQTIANTVLNDMSEYLGLPLETYKSPINKLEKNLMKLLSENA
jgi:hypothetical protein